MLILAIETSTLLGSVAIVDDEHVVAEYNFDAKETHSARLMPAIDTLLRDAGLKVQDIEALACAIGPGSFTGLRIGLATLKGLALVIKKPLLGLPTLDAMAWAFSFSPYLICPMVDARMKEVFSAFYRFEKGEMHQLTPYLTVSIKDLLQEVKEEVLFLGSGADLYVQEIEQRLGNKALFPPHALRLPRASLVALLAQRRLLQGEIPDLALLEPIYGRRSEAERKKGIIIS